MLNNFQPKEVLFEKKKKDIFLENFGSKFYTFKLDDWIFTPEAANDRLLKQFETSSLKGFGIQNLSYGIVAAGAILYYLDITQHEQLGHITGISRIEENRYVWLDKFTIKNLELFSSPYEGAKTLIDVMDRTISPMGGRMLKRWISLPIKDIQPINERLDIVQHLVGNDAFRDEISGLIRQIGDLERLLSKVAVNRINPREVVHLRKALRALEPLKILCTQSGCKPLVQLAEQLNPRKVSMQSSMNFALFSTAARIILLICRTGRVPEQESLLSRLATIMFLGITLRSEILTRIKCRLNGSENRLLSMQSVISPGSLKSMKVKYSVLRKKSSAWKRGYLMILSWQHLNLFLLSR
jgi:DNA mismatch repair ATPase MutS